MSAIDVAPVRPGPLAPGIGRIRGWAITSYFGDRIDPLTGRPGRHGGMDLAYAGCFGAEILAPVPGYLSQGWDGSGGGWWSSLSGADGDYWGFGHASRYVWPEGGSRWVGAGDVIAYVGTSGASTGAHLHIAFQPAGAGSYQDPYDVLVAQASARRGGRQNLNRTPPGDEIDMADIEELRTEFVNQDARIRAYVDEALAAKDARDRAFMIALVVKATRAIGGDDALARLRAEVGRNR
jgi:murein DD-endopeptidase MepM/ murein hydrolase activator NlpD